MSGLRPAVFLDRDGVLNEWAGPHAYVRTVDELRLLPGIGEAAAALARAGYVLLVVSNQRGVARGLVEPAALAAIEERIQAALEPAGARIAGFYYCTHDLDAGCDCRKPAPGLVLRAAGEHGIDLGASALVGDDETDVQAGRAAGVLTVRVGPERESSGADLIAADLPAGAAAILAQARPAARSISSA